MNAVTNTFRQLVRSKLWPVAVLLLAALVAVPFLLGSEPEAPAAVTPVATGVEADDTIADPILTALTPEDRGRRRRVLGARKDPFEPAPVKKIKIKTPEATATPDAIGGGTGGAQSGGEPAVKKTYFKAGTIVVRFGEASDMAKLDRFAVPLFGPVPDEEFPLLVYMGLTKDGKRAKFLVDAALEVDGDGTCKPHPASCEVIELAVGETEFLDVMNPDTETTEEETTSEEDDTVETDVETEPEVLGTYQLDLVDIKRAGDSDVR